MLFLHPVFEQPPIRHVQLAVPCVLPSPYSVGASTQTPGSGAPGGHQPDQGRTQPGADSQQPQTPITTDDCELEQDIVGVSGMTHRLTNDRAAAVSLHHEFMPMDTCPHNTKVILLGGVAVISQWDGKNTFWRGWFPLPKAPKPHTSPPTDLEMGIVRGASV